MLTVPFVDGQNVYMLISLFILYSFFGWLIESLYMSICNRKVTNRGFIRGPFCPIYGIGEIFVYYLLYPYSNNYVFLFLLGAILASFIEFLTAKLMIRVFGYVWWDYSNKPLNYKGILCLESSVAWGGYIIIEFLILHNLMVWVVQQFNNFSIKVFSFAFIIYYLYEFRHSLNCIKKGDVTAQENNLLAVTPKNN